MPDVEKINKEYEEDGKIRERMNGISERDRQRDQELARHLTDRLGASTGPMADLGQQVDSLIKEIDHAALETGKRIAGTAATVTVLTASALGCTPDLGSGLELERGGSKIAVIETFKQFQQEYAAMVGDFAAKVNRDIAAGRITGVKPAEVFYKLINFEIGKDERGNPALGKARGVEALAIKNSGLILIQEKEKNGIKVLETRVLAEEGRRVEFCRNCVIRVPEFEIVTQKETLKLQGPDLTGAVFRVNNKPELLLIVNQSETNIRQDSKGATFGILRIPVRTYLKVPAGKRLRQDAGFEIAGELQDDFSVKFQSTNPGIKTWYAVYEPISGRWTMNDANTIFEPLPGVRQVVNHGFLTS